MKFLMSVLLMLATVPVLASDRNAVCQCTEVVRQGEVQGVNLWVYWTDASGRRHHDLVGSFSGYSDCRAEARERSCRLR